MARVASLLDANGILADRYLEGSRISPHVREDAVVFVPGRSVWVLVDAADRGTMLGTAAQAEPPAPDPGGRELVSLTELAPGLTPVSDHTGEFWHRSTLVGAIPIE